MNTLADDDIEEIVSGSDKLRLTYASLKIATNNFSTDRVIDIGQGGLGNVYGGVLPNGTPIAVKIPTDWSSMRTEMVCPRIRHPNIVQVFGYCLHPLLVVMEYPGDNGNLYNLLHDPSPERKQSIFLNWHKRLAICIGIARGLSYLHEEANPSVIHRDIKSRNILLDNNFVPKIIDFSLALCFSDYDQLPLRENPAGTFGYIDPEYANYGRLTEKADVYSFGVVMLEILSGRRALILEPDVDDDNRFITRWASELVRNETVLEIIDPLLTDLPPDVARHFIDVAISCINREGETRPSMREVVLTLESLDGGSNSLIQSPIHVHTLQIDDTSYNTYISAASSFRSSTTTTEYLEDEGNTSISEGEGNVTLTEIESAGSNTELQVQGEIQGDETPADRQQGEQNNAAIASVAPFWQKQTRPGIIPSGSGPTAMSRAHPEAVYPPFRARVYQRYGSRNLYTF